jgi:transposase-like protein
MRKNDGPGIIKAIEACFPRAARQRRVAHGTRHLAAKLPEDVKARAQASHQASIRAIECELAPGVIGRAKVEQNQRFSNFCRSKNVP